MLTPMRVVGLIVMAAVTTLPVAPPVASRSMALLAEPDAVVLTEARTIQAVVVDLDADGTREIVALTYGPDDEIRLEAWAEDAGGAWQPVGDSLGDPLVVPPLDADLDDADGEGRGPVRLHVRATDGGERLTLARQPIVGPPDFALRCCLHLDDVVLDGGRLRLEPVAEPRDAVGALTVIDLDGDGVDELVASTSLPPLGDIGYPVEMLTFRWTGTRFATPVRDELPVGSGDSRFVLGESDGRPGEELGIIATIGRPAFYRISLVDGHFRVEDARIPPPSVRPLGVPIGDGAGIAIREDDGTLQLRPWPAGEPLGEPIAEARARDAAALLGTLEVDGRDAVVVRQASGAEALHLLALPLLNAFGPSAPGGPAAPAFGASPIRPYTGPLPGGGPHGGAAIVVAGWLVEDASPEPIRRVGLLAGAAPIGFAGRDRGWIAIHHLPAAELDPTGGRLDPPAALAGSGITVARFATFATAEEGGAVVGPAVAGRVVEEEGRLTVGASGFTALVDAPPGSRVHVAGPDPSVVEAVHVVGPEARAEIPMPPGLTGVPDAHYRAILAVTTPAGHGYVATWDVEALPSAPALAATATTQLASGEVIVAGRTAPGAVVRVGGTPIEADAGGRFTTTVPAPPWPTDVEVTVTDALGNEARAVVSAVGYLDYRGLPWVPILSVLVAVVALVLALRMPRPRASGIPASDDAILEELEPD